MLSRPRPKLCRVLMVLEVMVCALILLALLLIAAAAIGQLLSLLTAGEFGRNFDELFIVSVSLLIGLVWIAPLSLAVIIFSAVQWIRFRTDYTVITMAYSSVHLLVGLMGKVLTG